MERTRFRAPASRDGVSQAVAIRGDVGPLPSSSRCLSLFRGSVVGVAHAMPENVKKRLSGAVGRRQFQHVTIRTHTKDAPSKKGSLVFCLTLVGTQPDLAPPCWESIGACAILICLDYLRSVSGFYFGGSLPRGISFFHSSCARFQSSCGPAGS